MQNKQIDFSVHIYINRLATLGLRKVDFSRKPSTGEHKFIDDRTGEVYVTHTNGYIQRDNRGARGPINKRTVRKKHRTWTSYDVLKEPSEIARLELLVQYMIRKNARFEKNGTKYYGAPEPRDIKRARLEAQWEIKKQRTAKVEPIQQNLYTMRQATQRILDRITRYQLDGEYDVKKESFEDLNLLVRLTADLLAKISDFKK